MLDCLARIGVRHVDRVEPMLSRQPHHRQNALRVAQTPIKRKLADEERPVDRLGHLPRRYQDPNGDRKIIRRGLVDSFHVLRARSEFWAERLA